MSLLSGVRPARWIMDRTFSSRLDVTMRWREVIAIGQVPSAVLQPGATLAASSCAALRSSAHVNGTRFAPTSGQHSKPCGIHLQYPARGRSLPQPTDNAQLTRRLRAAPLSNLECVSWARLEHASAPADGHPQRPAPSHLRKPSCRERRP
jgi:hypothetical protein